MKMIKYGQGDTEGCSMIWASGDLWEPITNKLRVTVDMYVKSTLPFV